MVASTRLIKLIDGPAPADVDWPICPWEPADFLPAYFRTAKAFKRSDEEQATERTDG